MKAVLDVGQFVSATIRTDGHPAQILDAWKSRQFELVISPTMLADLRRVLFYPHIRRRHKLDDEAIVKFVDDVAQTATLTSGADVESIVKDDPSDDKIVACAVEGRVDYIVASDGHLTDLGSYAGIPIVRPRQFLGILRAHDENSLQANE